MNEQLTSAIIAGLESMPIEARFLLRGIQIGMAVAEESEAAKREELIRCGLYEASYSGQSAGNHSSH